KAPDAPAAVSEDDGHVCTRLENAESLGEGCAQKTFVAFGRAVLVLAGRVNNGLRSMIRDLAQLCLVEKVHVAVKDVAPKRRIGKDVVDRLCGQMRQIARGCQDVVKIVIRAAGEQRRILKKRLIGTSRRFNLPPKKLKDIPLI